MVRQGESTGLIPRPLLTPLLWNGEEARSGHNLDCVYLEGILSVMGGGGGG